MNWQVFLFYYLKDVALLSSDKSAMILIFIPLNIMCLYPLTAFRIFSLILVFRSLNMMCVDVCVCVYAFCLGFSELLRTVICCLSLFLENSQLLSPLIFFLPFSLSLCFGIQITHTLDNSTSSTVLRCCVQFLLFFSVSSLWVIFIDLSSSLPIP